MDDTVLLWALGGTALATALPRLKRRLELSRAKHPSLTGHSRMAKRVASWLPGYAYDETQFFGADDAPHGSRMEWWYYNGHFEGRNVADPSAPPKKFSFFASFFACRVNASS